MRQTPETMKELLVRVKNKLHLKSLVIALSAIVVFTTTYMLILPAFTLDKQEAADQGGIDVVAAETVAETADTEVKEEAPAEAQEDQKAEEKADANTEAAKKSEDTDKAEKAEKTEKSDVKLLTKKKTINADQADGDKFAVSASIDANAKVPADVTITATELGNQTDEEKEIFAQYKDDALAALKNDSKDVKSIKSIKLYDISLESESQEEAVEPKAPVNVKIAYEDGVKVDSKDNVRIVHFATQENGEEKPVVLDKTDNNVEATVNRKSEMTEASFDTDGFSVFAVIVIEKEEGTLTVKQDGYEITINYTKEAKIPVGTELKVEMIDPESKQYEELWKKTLDKMNEGVEWTNQDEPDPRTGLSDMTFFDISLNYNGKAIEPEVPLDVHISYENGGIYVPEGEKPLVVHFAKKGTELIEDVQIDTVSTKNVDIPLPNGEIATSYEYEQGSFSVVGIGSTAEFGEGIVSGPAIKLAAANANDSEIAASKTVTDTDGDGVYELALNVTGASEKSSSTSVNKSNVVIVIDTSGSMGGENYVYTPYTYSEDTYDEDQHYYRRRNNGEYAEVFYWPGGNYYGQYHAAGWYRINSWTSHTGTVYLRQTRMEATKDAAKDLVTALLKNNKPAGTVAEDGTRLDDIVEISLIDFSGSTSVNGATSINDATIWVEKSTSESSLHGYIDSFSPSGGTNWEAALRRAKTAADAYSNQTGETTSVIFLTDGMPTFYLNNANSRSAGNGGSGTENRDNVHNSWTYAADDARALVNGGYKLYNIFAFGTNKVKFDNDGDRTDADYLKALTNYAYTGSGTYANTGTTQYTRDYFYNASDTTALTRAFQAIIDNINNTVGYGGVEYDDGVTLGVTNTSVAVDGHVHDESFRYKVTGTNNQLIYSVKIVNGTATFEIPGKEGTYTDNTSEKVITKIDESDSSTWIESEVYSVEVDGVTYKMSPASINADTGMVDWDLAGLGILENGYTYTVAFDVWPKQYAYDMVADLNNGVKTKEQLKADVIAAKIAEGMSQTEAEAFWQKIDDALIGPDANNQYAVRTNYQQKVDYYTVNTEEDDQGNVKTTYSEKQTKDVDFDGDIALTSKPIPMTKVWNSNLSPDQIGNLLYKDYPTNSEPTEYKVTLHLWKADTAAKLQNLIEQYAGNPTTASANDYIEKTLGWNGSDYDWDDSVTIAPGTMVSLSTAEEMGIPLDDKNKVTYDGQQYYIIEKGHYYYVTEDNIDWHFELETVLYHPMLVNGTLKNVTFITDAEGNITGVEDIEDMTQVAATNSKTAELDITKKIDDQTGKLTDDLINNETFTYKVTLTVPIDADMSHTNAYEWVARYNDDVSAANRYYVYGYQRGEDPSLLGLEDDVARFDGKVYGRYTVSHDYAADDREHTLNGIFTPDADGKTKTGEIYITLKQNEIIRLTNLPSKTEYKIEEMYNNLYQADPSRDADSNLGNNAPASNIEENGYDVTIATKNGTPTVSGKVVTGTITTLNKRYYNQFTNTLKDTAVVDLSVTKHLQGYQWSGERYNMKLEASNTTSPLPRITTRYLTKTSGSDDVTFNFGSVHLKPGVYTYTIKETDNDFNEVYSGKTINGVMYDQIKTIKISVANDLTVTIDGSSDGVTYNAETNTVDTKVTNKTLPISIYKIGKSDTENALAGVQFQLYSNQNCTAESLVTEDASGNAIGSTETIDGTSYSSVLTTNALGTVEIGTLNTGTYYLKEIKTNPGYNLLDELVVITVSSNGTISYEQGSYAPSKLYNSAHTPTTDLDKANGGLFITNTDSDGNATGYTLTVNNSTGETLPNSGGIGTTIFYVLGSLLVLGCGIMLVARRRMGSMK